VEKALTGADVRVDVNAIEKQLSELWREEKGESERAVTRAALWNVVAHTWTAEHHTKATQTLGLASAHVPQRTIVVQARLDGPDEIAAWISANCHMVGKGRQVCSEEVAITASGGRIGHVPPVVNALLLPDMPVAVWWIGDLPSGSKKYVESLLEPADRLIVDSSHFSSAADLDLLCWLGDNTFTAPADLNWVRLEEWRAATAALFDPPSMRSRLGGIAAVRVKGGGDGFGGTTAARLFASWISAQTQRAVNLHVVDTRSDGIESIEILFDDHSSAAVIRDPHSGALIATSSAGECAVEFIARGLGRSEHELIVRLLKNPATDHVYMRALREARKAA
jgi:glucose-6-phosphate dehydrogenase assembly protein OpcA